MATASALPHIGNMIGIICKYKNKNQFSTQLTLIHKVNDACTSFHHPTKFPPSSLSINKFHLWHTNGNNSRHASKDPAIPASSSSSASTRSVPPDSWQQGVFASARFGIQVSATASKTLPSH